MSKDPYNPQYSPLRDPILLPENTYILDRAMASLELDTTRPNPKNGLRIRGLARIVYHDQIKERKWLFLKPGDPYYEESADPNWVPPQELIDKLTRPPTTATDPEPESDPESEPVPEPEPEPVPEPEPEPEPQQPEEPPMSTERQRESARANSQHSTGPRTEAGKARSAMNALKTGIDAKTVVLPDLEKQEDYDAVITSWHEAHPAHSPEMRTLVDQLACAEWYLRRLARANTAILIRGAEHAFKLSSGAPLGHMYLNMSTTMGRCQRQITQMKRDFHTDLEALQQMEAKFAASQPATPPAPEPEPPQPVESEPETPESTSFRFEPFPTPPGHPADFHDCPSCDLAGHQRPGCLFQTRPETGSDAGKKDPKRSR